MLKFCARAADPVYAFEIYMYSGADQTSWTLGPETPAQPFPWYFRTTCGHAVKVRPVAKVKQLGKWLVRVSAANWRPPGDSS